MSTGDELRDLHNAEREEGQGIWHSWDTNRPTLKTALETLGYIVVDLGIVKDGLVALISILDPIYKLFTEPRLM